MGDPSDPPHDRRTTPRPALTPQGQSERAALVAREQQDDIALAFRQNRDKALDIHAEKQALLREHLRYELPPPGQSKARGVRDFDRQAEINVAASHQDERRRAKIEATKQRMAAEAGHELDTSQPDRRQSRQERASDDERRAAIAAAKQRLGVTDELEKGQVARGGKDPLAPEQVSDAYIRAVDDASPDKAGGKEAARADAIRDVKERFAQEASRNRTNDRNG